MDLTDSNPIKHKSHPIPYKMQEIIDKEIEDMQAMGVIERSEAPYASCGGHFVRSVVPFHSCYYFLLLQLL